MTTRLNTEHRTALLALARKVVIETLDTTEEVRKFQKALSEEAHKIVLAYYNQSEMLILKKYKVSVCNLNWNFAHHDTSDVFQVRIGSHIKESDFKSEGAYNNAMEELAVYIPDRWEDKGRNHRATKKLSTLQYEYEAVLKRHQVAYNEMYSRYSAIINHYKTYESLVEVWPEAGTISASIRANLPAVISNEMIEQVKAESLARMKKLQK